MKILITGGCGFVGSNVARYALGRGHEVVAFDNLVRIGSRSNLDEFKAENNFLFIEGDVREQADFEAAPEVDAVIHTAAQPGVPTSMRNPRYDFEVNALGTFNVLEFARERGLLPLIFTSTNKCYSCEVNEIGVEMAQNGRVFTGEYRGGIPEGFPVDSAGKAAYSPYGCSKYTGDRYCQEYWHTYEVPTVVNRMSCIAGERQMGVEEQGWVAWFAYAKMFHINLNIFGDGKQTRDVLYVGDLARLFLEELEHIDRHRGQVYNVGGGPDKMISLQGVIDHLVDLEGSLFDITYHEWRQADHLAYYTDITKVSEFWQPEIGPIETVDRIWDWAGRNRSRIWRMLKKTLGEGA